MNIDPSVFNKSLETINTAGKIVANLTDPKRPQSQPNNPPPKGGDKSSNNQPHTQTVEVKVGDPENRNKPMVIHEKKEEHIHKTYPDDRAMSKEECEVEKLRIQTAHENAKEDREFRLQMDERDRKERRERDEYERRRREEAAAAKKKSDRRFWICASLFGAAFLGATGYFIYDDYRNSRITGLPVQEPITSLKIKYGNKSNPNKPAKSSKPILAEGSVK